MKKVFYINMFLLLFISCSKDEDDSLIVGTWNEIYVLGTIYDLQTGEIIGEHGYSAKTIATFYNSGKLIWKMLGITSEGSYNISDNSLNIAIDSKTKSYTIEEFISGKLILSTEEIDQEKQIREKMMRVFIKTDYQLTEDYIMKYTGPYPDWGVTRGR